MGFARRLSTVQGRLSAGSLFALSLIAGFWDGHTGDIDPVRLTACIGAGIAWTFAELASGRSVSARDKALYETFKAEIPQSMLDFLRHHDFGASYIDPGKNGMFAVAEWRGARYEYVDVVLQKHWLLAHSQIKEFAHILATNTFPLAGPINSFTVHPTHGDPESPEPFVQNRIDILNDSASKAVDAIDTFERWAARRLQL